MVTTTHRLNDYVLGEIGTGRREQNTIENYDVSRCCRDVK